MLQVTAVGRDGELVPLPVLSVMNYKVAKEPDARPSDGRAEVDRVRVAEELPDMAAAVCGQPGLPTTLWQRVAIEAARDTLFSGDSVDDLSPLAEFEQARFNEVLENFRSHSSGPKAPRRRTRAVVKAPRIPK